jgi:hypothetical protein
MNLIVLERKRKDKITFFGCEPSYASATERCIIKLSGAYITEYPLVGPTNVCVKLGNKITRDVLSISDTQICFAKPVLDFYGDVVVEVSLDSGKKWHMTGLVIKITNDQIMNIPHPQFVPQFIPQQFTPQPYQFQVQYQPRVPQQVPQPYFQPFHPTTIPQGVQLMQQQIPIYQPVRPVVQTSPVTQPVFPLRLPSIQEMVTSAPKKVKQEVLQMKLEPIRETQK